ncbi:hypothetical protein GGR56DRAFT_612251 [Xylariaceae sp. FL0804]|nr:hypothetical protein GGR56DRAFT_612251 [Xylariaceae sp. FL0804]
MGSSDPSQLGAPPETGPNLSPRRRRIRRKHKSPEVGSLYDTMYDHAGESLFVLPICWTDFHKQLLGCRFIARPPHNTPTPSSKLSPQQLRETPIPIFYKGRILDRLMSDNTTILAKTIALRDILRMMYPNHLSKSRYSADLDLRFGHRRYPNAVRCQWLWQPVTCASASFSSATTVTASQSASHMMASMSVNVANNGPVLAYVSRDYLKKIRTNCFRIARGPSNAPVCRLQQLRSKNLMPKNADEDQYLIAVMIAMAQHSVYGNMWQGTDFEPRDTPVRVVTTSEGEENLIVYSATVPEALLMMFHDPDKAPRGNTQFEIEYARVPVWPVLGLKERLGQALGADVVGDFANVPMDTYENELQQPATPESASPKRRRGVLEEVLNASFSEDRESDCHGRVLGKRTGKRICLEEGKEDAEGSPAASVASKMMLSTRGLR